MLVTNFTYDMTEICINIYINVAIKEVKLVMLRSAGNSERINIGGSNNFVHNKYVSKCDQGMLQK